MPTAFPDVIACFALVLTLPVASATAERSFLVMRRVKSHLRASMADTDSRLSSLSVIVIEWEVGDHSLPVATAESICCSFFHFIL